MVPDFNSLFEFAGTDVGHWSFSMKWILFEWNWRQTLANDRLRENPAVGECGRQIHDLGAASDVDPDALVLASNDPARRCHKRTDVSRARVRSPRQQTSILPRSRLD